MTRLAAAVLAALLPLGAAAQTFEPGASGLSFTLGAGVGTVPGYFGSDEAVVGPDLTFDLGYVDLGPFEFGDRDPAALRRGLGFRGSFRYVPERSADDYEELSGLDDVDRSFELGGGLRYAQPRYEAFAVARYGFGGSEAVVGELGLDLIARPTDRLALRAGPRVLLGNDDYAATYFGVTDEEAAASAFPAFDADGGVLSSGIELGADYQLGGAWGVNATARYDRFQNDAGDSPITAEDDQLSASVALTRRFTFGF